MDKADINKLYKKLEKLGVFDEVNTLLWTFTTGAARTAYKEGKDDGRKDGFKDGYTKGKHEGYELAMKKMAQDAMEF